jgi:dihydrolipoamide dehydrogenase
MYDAVIIGGGPGGYTCAIRVAQLGGKVCLIEKNGMGGTCTQRGCIPTKYLHSLGDTIRRASNAKKNGLDFTLKMDYKLLKSRMEATVSRLASGINLLLKSNGINVINGQGKIVSRNEIIVNDKSISAKNIVIATGSYPVCLPGTEFGGKILSTTSILELDELPESVTVIGAGYSGCEFASILNALGCKVSLVEAEDHIIPGQIREIGDTMEKYMALDGIDVRINTRVEKIMDSIVYADGKKIESEKILVCTGRRPKINADELYGVGIDFDERGISVDSKMHTNISNIYAIGDVTGLYELAHVAAKQGEVAAENIMGMEQSGVDYRCVPACIFTYPEIAFVGELNGKAGEFPFTASGKAQCLSETRGLVKVFVREGILVGSYVIGPHAGEMLGEISLAIKMKLAPKDIFEMIHAHPTLPESLVDALRDITGESIHLPIKNHNKNGSDKIVYHN